MKVLVTGAAGFIGSALCRHLLKRGDEVLGIDNLNPYYDVELKQARLALAQSYPNFRFQKLDIKDRGALGQSIQDFVPHRVVHLAAQAGVRYSLTHPEVYVEANLVGFANILEACRKLPVQHLVYASSSSVYGANKKTPFSVNDRVDHPVSFYAATKRANEVMAHSYSHLYELPVTGLRFFTVYGPWGRPDMSFFIFTKAIIEGRPIRVFNNGKHQRDFTYIDDIIGGVARVLDNPPAPNPKWNALEPDPNTSRAPYRLYNIGNNQPVWLEDMIQCLESIIGKKAIKEYESMQPGDVEGTFADIETLSDDFGFRPSTSIEEGAKNFVKWYRDYFRV